jgi:hypothetical protein
MVAFDVFDSGAQALFLVRGQVGQVAFGVNLKKIDESGLEDEQVDHPCAAALASAFSRSPHFAESAQAGNEVAHLGMGREEFLEFGVFGIRPQVRALFCKRWGLDEGQHRVIQCIGFKLMQVET